MYNTRIHDQWAPIRLKQIVHFCPGYDSLTWWRNQRIKKYYTSSLGNGPAHRTVTMAAPLLLTSGLVWYEAELHNTFLVISFVCVRNGKNTGDGLE